MLKPWLIIHSEEYVCRGEGEESTIKLKLIPFTVYRCHTLGPRTYDMAKPNVGGPSLSLKTYWQKCVINTWCWPTDRDLVIDSVSQATTASVVLGIIIRQRYCDQFTSVAYKSRQKARDEYKND